MYGAALVYFRGIYSRKIDAIPRSIGNWQLTEQGYKVGV